MAGEKHFQIRDVVIYLREKYGLEISYDMVYYWLRRVLKRPYGKPYLVDKRRPENAEEMLEVSLRECIVGKDGFVLVFMDETSFRASPSTVRIFNPGKIRVARDTRRFTLFGGLAVNGVSVALKVGRANRWNFIKFLEMLREANGFKPIVLVLDNASFHWAAEARFVARELNIELCYLPPYSPDLNPIEVLWRDLKRFFALRDFEEISVYVEEVFLELAGERRYTYTGAWLRRFSHILDEFLAVKSEAVKSPRI